MNRFSKSFIIALTFVTVTTSLFPIAPFTHTQRANATVVTIDFALNAIQEASAIQGLYEWAEEFVLETLKRRLLDMMVDQIIQWIQGGGKPSFVTDWDGFLKDAANVAIGDLVQDAGFGFVCDPFGLHIRISLLPVPRFTQQITCTLDDIVGNINNFYGDFRNGSWLAYQATAAPQNNIYGALLRTWDEKNKRVADATSALRDEAVAGGGFLSTRSCSESSSRNSPDLDGDGTPGDIPSSCIVTTPGNVIGDTVAKAIGSDIDYIVNADQLAAYAAAIANALINRVVTEGVDGLTGVSSNNAPPGGFNTGSGQCQGLSGVSLTACQNYVNASQGNLATAKTTLIAQINKTLGPRQIAQTTFAGSETRLGVYVIDMQNIVTQYNFLNCTQKPTHLNALATEIQYATSTILSLQTEQATNQAVISQLIAAEANINAIPPGDWAAFGILAGQITSSGILNEIAALNLQTQAENQNQALQTRITNTLIIFNQNVSSC